MGGKGYKIICIVCIFLLALIFSHSSVLAADKPVIFYTDITSGPNKGGENNNGAYLSIFGKNFGNDISKIKVYVGNGEVARYMYLGPSKGMPDIQQLSVQLGPNTTTGAIRVVVSGVESNTEHTFTIRPGDIYYVALNGNDSTGKVNNINRPFRSVQKTFYRSDFGAGDHIVIKGGRWTDVGAYGAFTTIHNKSGTATDPLVIMGYPGELVDITITTNHTRGGFHTYYNPASVPSDPKGYYIISNLHIDLTQNPTGGGCINLGSAIENIRIVNIEGYGMRTLGGGSACIGGDGRHFKILGNHLHDNGGNKLYHAIYIANGSGYGTDDIEIAYNYIHTQWGGRGIQIYHGQTGVGITNVSVHHNLIHDIALDGVLFGDASGVGFAAYNNIVYHTAVQELRSFGTDQGKGGACIRFNSSDLVAQVFNNTFYNCGVDTTSGATAIEFQRANQVTIRNNIVIPVSGVNYFRLINVSQSQIISSNNLWYGAGAAPSWDINLVNAVPLFINPSAGDFHLQSNSPAIDNGTALEGLSKVVTKDFDGNARPQGAGYDIGAYEYVGPQNTKQNGKNINAK